jgi:hypothetical protein
MQLLLLLFLLLPANLLAATFPLEVLPEGIDLQPERPFSLTVRGQWPDKFQSAGIDYASGLSQMTLQSLAVNERVENQLVLYEAQLQVVAPAAGLYVIPPFSMPLQASDGTLARAESRRLFLEIPKGAVAAAELRANKDLQRVSWQLGWLWWLLGGLVMLAAAAFAYWRWLGRARAVSIDPYSEFNGALVSLRNQHDVDAPLIKEAAFKLSHIARQYVERRGQIAALEMTGKELAHALANTELPGPDRQPWLELASCCHDLENIKYQPGGVSDQSVATWCARAARHVEQVETMLNQAPVKVAA